jgi:glyoxylase-like metal-dependent hydrolase (beta-lactamase superfamily II)
MIAEITGFFDEPTNAVSYIVRDPGSAACAIIDSVLGFDPVSGRIDTAMADRIADFVGRRSLDLMWHLETHVHADHLSAAVYLKRRCGGRIAISARISEVQREFAGLFNVEAGFPTDGGQFDHLFGDDEAFSIGGLAGVAMQTPGHTPACMTFLIGDAAFVGDTLFMPDYGTARADFPGGDARQLYQSVQRVLSLPLSTRLFLCHDYKAPGRDEFRWETTVAEQRSANVHVHDGISEAEFVKMRTERDARLSLPKLFLPAVQINIRSGALPPPESNGTSYVKIPLIGVSPGKPHSAQDPS